MIIFLFILAIAIEIGLPIAIARRTTRRYAVPWSLFFIGMATFFLSQVGHIPFLTWMTSLFATGALPNPSPQFAPYFNAIMLGLAAGIFEETARLIAYLLLKGRARSWGAALTLGAGHGGLESILVGLSVLASLVLVLVAAQGGLGNLGLPANIADTIQMQADTFWTQPWYTPLLGAVERIGAVILHITLSVMVWLAVVRRNAGWFVLAVLYHALIDAVVVLGSTFGVSILVIEGVFTLFALINLGILFSLSRWVKRWPPEPQPVQQVMSE